ncbi:hypothetical protein BS78_02G238200 [Paspalum vaginatum]|nr:hypothetical protein BS78_02G238200 [Paspalum vaginatum]
MADWSSLPGDLINRIAGRLLAADDLDYYMDFRTVCQSWRSATADPKNSPHDPRFQPRQWVMLDVVHEGHHQSDARLFVNAATGRFVRKDLPLLRRYYLIAGAFGGLLVLAEKSSPHAALLLNPFTGSLTRLAVSTLLHLHVIHGHDGGALASSITPLAQKIVSGLASTPLAGYFSGDEGPVNKRCLLVESAREILIVDIERMNVFEKVKNLGSRALFVGDRRCLSVDAEKFASVEANCIYFYFAVDEPGRLDSCVYSLNDETEFRFGIPLASEASPPSDAQLLCSYAMVLQRSELGWDQMMRTFSALTMNISPERWLEMMEFELEDY